MPTPAPNPPTQDSIRYYKFFNDLLQGLGITPSPGALQGLADVVHEEGPNAYWNPFNIEWHPGDNTAWQGASNFNSVGVQEYADAQHGLDATAAFLQDNSNWQPLLSALATGSKQQVDNAMSQIYTWAPFHPASPDQANNILADAMGTSTNPVVDKNGKQTTTTISVPGVSTVEGGLSAIATAVGSLGTVFQYITWIFNVDHFYHFLLYVFGTVMILAGFGMVVFGSKAGEMIGAPA